MIQLARTSKTALIPTSLAGLKRVAKNRELIEQQIEVLNGTLDKIVFKSTFWKPAKDATKEESLNKCAYCESPTAVVAHGDIEHFRPKSEYWWLAYTFHNYCFCCQICNQTFKSDNFPIAGTKWGAPPIFVTTVVTDVLCSGIGSDPLTATEGLSLQKYKTNHTKEKTGLPDPYFDKPEQHFGWEADDTLREIKIIAKTNSATNKRRLKAVEDFFGLNRKELKVERYRVFETFRRFKRLEKATGLNAAEKKEIRDQLALMMEAAAPYAAMCRFFDQVL